MIHSIQNVKKGILRLEKVAAKKKQAAKTCNCRDRITFHNAECLEALLMNIPWLCPAHGVRQLGRFVEIASKNILRYRGGGADGGYFAGGDDNRFCPCPLNPWTSFLLSEGPHTMEQSDAAQKAWANLPPKPRISSEEWKRQRAEKTRRVHAVIERHAEAVQQFNDSGRKSPGPREIFRRGRAGESKDVDG